MTLFFLLCTKERLRFDKVKRKHTITISTFYLNVSMNKFIMAQFKKEMTQKKSNQFL